MPHLQLASPLRPEAPVDVFYRLHGTGEALLILHGGWGYGFYPFEPQIAALPDFQIIAPDRTGYGQSSRVDRLPPRFHHAAAAEHEALVDALGITRYAIWGHSDGAVIASIMALRRPERVSGVVLEALHLDRAKPASRAFFTSMRDAPEDFGPRVIGKLAAEHGDGEHGFRAVLRAGGTAWLDIAATPDDDLYDHKLAQLAVPVLVLHGADDPRTEPGELDRFFALVPRAQRCILPGGGHSPHSERATSAAATAAAARFLRTL